jgi:hypothetical protein
MRAHDKLVKKFLLLTLVQVSGEATLSDVDELCRIRKKLYKLYAQ